MRLTQTVFFKKKYFHTCFVIALLRRLFHRLFLYTKFLKSDELTQHFFLTFGFRRLNTKNGDVYCIFK